jgi:hemerythrin-like domain-containing protein
MQNYATKGIKEIIEEFPGVGKILEEYGIGCGPCTIGICRLDDVVEIHAMPKAAEKELMLRIEAEIYPDRDLRLPANSKKTGSPVVSEHTFSAPMQVLVDEHKLIKRWLAQIARLVVEIDLDSPGGRLVAEKGVELIRSYADRLHHTKEEDILFGYFDDSEDIFQVIYEDHKRARELVQHMLSGLAERNTQRFCASLKDYGALLEEHIHKEDEVLFPWLDRKLTEAQKNELMTRFAEADTELNVDENKYLAFVDELEQHESR